MRHSAAVLLNGTPGMSTTTASPSRPDTVYPMATPSDVSHPAPIRPPPPPHPPPPPPAAAGRGASTASRRAAPVVGLEPPSGPPPLGPPPPPPVRLIPTLLVGIRPGRYTRNEHGRPVPRRDPRALPAAPQLRHAGQPIAAYEGANPLCGDRITMMLAIERRRVERVGFTGRGCAISQASASMLTDEIRASPSPTWPASPRRTCSTCWASRSARRASSARCSLDTLQHAARRGRREAARSRRRPADGPLRLSPAGLSRHRRAPAPTPTPGVPDPSPSPRLAAAARRTLEHPSTDDQDLSELLREARAEIREVRPPRPTRCASWRRRADRRPRASEWDQGHIPGAAHVPRATSSRRSRPPRPTATRPSSCTARRHPFAVRGPDARRTWATRRRLDEGGFQAWKARAATGRSRSS